MDIQQLLESEWSGPSLQGEQLTAFVASDKMRTFSEN